MNEERTLKSVYGYRYNRGWITGEPSIVVYGYDQNGRDYDEAFFAYDGITDIKRTLRSRGVHGYSHMKKIVW